MNKLLWFTILLIGLTISLQSMVGSYQVCALYREPSFKGHITFVIPAIIKITHDYNKISEGYLWGHITITGIVNTKGWLPLCEWREK